MPTATYELIRRAIVEKKQITCTYQGRYREVCPHAIGTKGGREQTLVFQFGGDSSKGLSPGGEWRCMPVDGIADAAVREGPWHTDTNHSRSQTCVDVVDVEVDY